MNIDRLKQAEKVFLDKYPLGFNDPQSLEISEKKFKHSKTIKMVQNSFAKNNFENPLYITEQIIKTITGSAMVSVFEKVKFRDYVSLMKKEKKAVLSESLFEILHANQENGFNKMNAVLEEGKLAKWTLLTICPVYYYPQQEVLVKPTGAKEIIAYYELEGLCYKPKFSYDFYFNYKSAINQLKKAAHPSITTDNAAFLGFLMSHGNL